MNGGVELDSTGTARAETVNGGITARLGRADWTGALKLETVNGGIDVTMPDGLSADVQGLDRQRRHPDRLPDHGHGPDRTRKLEGTIGSGGRLLEMETVNGGIELRKGRKKSDPDRLAAPRGRRTARGMA